MITLKMASRFWRLRSLYWRLHSSIPGDFHLQSWGQCRMLPTSNSIDMHYSVGSMNRSFSHGGYFAQRFSTALEAPPESRLEAQLMPYVESTYEDLEGLDQFIGPGSILPTTIIFLEYGLAMASQNVVLLVHFFTGLILMVILFIMGLIETTTGGTSFLKDEIRKVFGVCPQYDILFPELTWLEYTLHRFRQHAPFCWC